MLTYATVADFSEMKNLGKSGLITVSEAGLDKIESYLSRATRHIRRFTKRDFYPWIEEREFPIPYSYFDLNIRKFPSAHLKLDQDLLEVINLNNGAKDLTSDDYFTLEHNVYPKSILAVKFPNYWGGLTGGLTPYSRYDSPIVKVTAIWGYFDYQYPREAWLDTHQVIQNIGGISSYDTIIEVGDVVAQDSDGYQGIAKGRLLRVDNELMEVTEIDPALNTATVKRAVRGSDAVSHDENTGIRRWRVVEDIVQATLETAKAWRESGLSVGGRIGVSDQSVGVELGIPQDAAEIIRAYQRSLLYG